LNSGSNFLRFPIGTPSVGASYYAPKRVHENRATPFRLPSGRRADAVNLETREVLELKPNNPRALQRGQRQLETYLKELEQTYRGTWTGRVVPYNR